MSDMSAVPDDPNVLLAYYDARAVSDERLCKIFMCQPSDLMEARGSEAYKAALAGQIAGQVSQATELDDTWNTVEQNSLQSLQECLPAMNDPRMLLAIAVQANKAGRRNGKLTPQASTPPEIHVPAEGGQSKVVRLRARFVEALSDPHGAQRILDRQIEIQMGDTGDLKEDLTPGEVKTILRNSIGVDPDQLAIRTHMGPDQMLGTLLDFSNITEESLPK